MKGSWQFPDGLLMQSHIYVQEVHATYLHNVHIYLPLLSFGYIVLQTFSNIVAKIVQLQIKLVNELLG